MQIQPASFAFTLLLGFFAAVPYSGIDINLPALAATGATFGVSPSEVGLTMSAFMLSLAVAPLIYRPVSDRFGRKPVVVFDVALFVVASLACAVAQSLPMLLACRFVQGVGAASTAMTFAIIRDLFDETTARAKIANVVVAIDVVTVIAPTAGAALITVGGWRSIYAIQAGVGALLLLAVLLGFTESTRIDPANRLAPAVVIRNYARVLTHPVSFAYVLVGAAGGAVVFAYVTGSSLFFLGVVGLRPDQYGLIFSACSAAVMSGALLDGRLGISAARVLTLGLTILAACFGHAARDDSGGLGAAGDRRRALDGGSARLRHDHAQHHERNDAAVAGYRGRRRHPSWEHSDDGRRGVERAGRSVI
jgi:DHA1 family bicyclomycin/chloramphenicol resistance-like MFS transporter